MKSVKTLDIPRSPEPMTLFDVNTPRRKVSPEQAAGFKRKSDRATHEHEQISQQLEQVKAQNEKLRELNNQHESHDTLLQPVKYMIGHCGLRSVNGLHLLQLLSCAFLQACMLKLFVFRVSSVKDDADFPLQQEHKVYYCSLELND
mmetsp:Transcript_45484/g.67576  ORF Transcript_45484/g.67576 Transcript_45484/m.67576 type:complete len:146 (-) Transcript_45484:172-609(-)